MIKRIFKILLFIIWAMIVLIIALYNIFHYIFFGKIFIDDFAEKTLDYIDSI